MSTSTHRRRLLAAGFWRLPPPLLYTFALLLFVTSSCTGYEVIYAINAGGEDHIDASGVHFERDPLLNHPNGVGIASDFGRSLGGIGRVARRPDEVLYQTERYHTATFGYDVPVPADGAYLLLLKFCEVYFNGPNLKVFDVLLNGEHTVVADLDIFRMVGRGNAHDEHIQFSVANGQLHWGDDGESSAIRDGRVRVEFIKGYRDNPKVNAIALFRGDVENVPRQQPLDGRWLNGVRTDGEDPADIGADGDEDAAVADDNEAELVNRMLKQQHQQQQLLQQQQQKRLNEEGGFVGGESNAGGGGGDQKPLSTNARARTSGPRQEDPYALDDSSVMLPVFIAIGAFIPLLFCLCKL